MNGRMIEDILSRMSLEQKVGQCVVVGMSGTVITNDLREAITRYHAGGLRLSPFTRIFRYFSDNAARPQALPPGFVPSMEKMARAGLPPHRSPEEYAAMLNELRALAEAREPAVPLHMVVDQEGDTSSDLARGGIVQFPSSLGLSAARDTDLTYRASRCVARQLKASGIDMIHSPVVDVNINPKNPEIGVRSFGDDPERVAEQAVASLRGFKEEGIIAAAKHFPGRGDSATDAHHACPVLDVDRRRMDKVELLPYRRLIAEGLDAIMAAHCIYPALDTEIATVSRTILTDLLRKELGFQGLITTDSMTMGALIDKYGVGDSCARALQAGADVVLMKAENRWRGEMFHTIRAWVERGDIPMQELDDKVRRILSLKARYGLFRNMGMVEAADASRHYRDPVVLSTARESALKAIVVRRDPGHLLPLGSSKRVLLVNQLDTIKSAHDSQDHPALFSELMERELPGLQTYETEFEKMGDEEERRVVDYAKGREFDVILCTNYYDRAARPHVYPRALVDAGLPVVIITNTPYSIGDGGIISDAPAIIVDMNVTPEGHRALRDVLLGRAAAGGAWPLSSEA